MNERKAVKYHDRLVAALRTFARKADEIDSSCGGEDPDDFGVELELGDLRWARALLAEIESEKP